MRPSRFDQISRALAAGLPRRPILLALVAVLAGRTAAKHAERTALAQTPTPTPAAQSRPDFPPIYVSPHPLPVGFGDFLIDGAIVPLDLEAVALLEGTPAVPIVAGGESVFIDPSSLFDNPAPEGICGLGDDSQDVALYRGNLGVSREFVDAHQSPVGCIQWNTTLFESFSDPGTVNAWRWCSGTLISEDLFLTAGHCFAQNPPGFTVPRVNGTNEPISRTEIALNMHVDFQYQLDAEGNDQLPVGFPIIELVEDQLGGLDYAIVRLANNPGLTYGLVRVAAADAPLGETVCIIGHPEGVPKRVAVGTASQNDLVRIYYNDIDTAGGSSGSCLLASPGGPIVGVHTNGGCDDLAKGNNHGVTISALLRESPILRSLAAKGPA